MYFLDGGRGPPPRDQPELASRFGAIITLRARIQAHDNAVLRERLQSR
jgi:hypothetical protein